MPGHRAILSCTHLPIQRLAPGHASTFYYTLFSTLIQFSRNIDYVRLDGHPLHIVKPATLYSVLMQRLTLAPAVGSLKTAMGTSAFVVCPVCNFRFPSLWSVSKSFSQRGLHPSVVMKTRPSLPPPQHASMILFLTELLSPTHTFCRAVHTLFFVFVFK